MLDWLAGILRMGPFVGLILIMVGIYAGLTVMGGLHPILAGVVILIYWLIGIGVVKLLFRFPLNWRDMTFQDIDSLGTAMVWPVALVFWVPLRLGRLIYRTWRAGRA